MANNKQSIFIRLNRKFNNNVFCFIVKDDVRINCHRRNTYSKLVVLT